MTGGVRGEKGPPWLPTFYSGDVHGVLLLCPRLGVAIQANLLAGLIAHETAAWVMREMQSETEGGYYSSLDADSEGEEGRFYVWSEQEIDSILGPDAATFKSVYDVTRQGNWEETNILNRSIPFARVRSRACYSICADTRTSAAVFLLARKCISPFQRTTKGRWLKWQITWRRKITPILMSVALSRP